MLDAGYGSSGRFYERAVPTLGMTRHLSARRRRDWASSTRSSTVLGALLVAATSRGVCAVSMGAREADLTAALRAEYPSATLSRVAAADRCCLRGRKRSSASVAAGCRSSSCRSTLNAAFQWRCGWRWPQSLRDNRCTPTSPARSAIRPPCAPSHEPGNQSVAAGPSPVIASSGRGGLAESMGIARQKKLLRRERERSHAGVFVTIRVPK